MPTTRVVRGSHSHSSLTKRRPFKLHTSKSSNFVVVSTAGRFINDLDDDSLTDTRKFIPPALLKRSIPKKSISLHTILKKKSSSIVRRMLSLDSDAYRAPQADIENVAIESESDDDATLVAGLHPPLVKKLKRYEAFSTKEACVEQLPSVMLGKKIRHYFPGFSDDEDDTTQERIGSHDEPTSKACAILSTPPPLSPRPIRSWNEILDAPGFEILKEDDRIVCATALNPPPWHRPKESMLVYEPAAGPDVDDKGWSGEPVRDFSW